MGYQWGYNWDDISKYNGFIGVFENGMGDGPINLIGNMILNFTVPYFKTNKRIVWSLAKLGQPCNKKSGIYIYIHIIYIYISYIYVHII